MRDLYDKWSALPDWDRPLLDKDALRIVNCPGLEQILISGALEAWRQAENLRQPATGGFAMAEGNRYTVALARDRLLAVDTQPFASASGWHPDGYALTALGGGLHVFDISGSAADQLVMRGASLDPGMAMPSAALSFAGQAAILYRRPAGYRLHIDRTLAAYLARWFLAVAEHLPGADP